MYFKRSPFIKDVKYLCFAIFSTKIVFFITLFLQAKTEPGGDCSVNEGTQKYYETMKTVTVIH